MATTLVSSTLVLQPFALSRPLAALPAVSVEYLCKQNKARTQSLTFRGIKGMAPNQEAVGVPRSVPVRVAHELLQAGHRYLDVRTPDEFSTGHAPDAINVPYMFRIGSGMTKNPNFVEEVASHFGKDDEIIIGCQIGKRSLMAATDLLCAGYTGITDIAGGFSAWVQNGLPTA